MAVSTFHEDIELNKHFYRNWFDFDEDANMLDRIESRGAEVVRRQLLSAYRYDEDNVFPEIERRLFGETRQLTPEDEELLILLITQLFGTSEGYESRINQTIDSLVRVARRTFSLTTSRLGTPANDIASQFQSIEVDTRVYAQTINTYFGEGTRNAMKRHLRRLQERGEIDPNNLIDELRHHYRSRDYIARTVSNTAVNNVIAETQMTAFKNDPLVEYVRWVTRGDSKVRLAHIANGRPGNNIRRVGDLWEIDGYPGRAYGCRCRGEPLIGEEVTVNANGNLIFTPLAS